MRKGWLAVAAAAGLAVTAAAGLAGCAAPNSEFGSAAFRSAPSGAAAAGSAAGSAAPGSAAGPIRPVFATQLAGPSTFLAPMPTAIAVLKPDDLNRNRAFCAAVTSRLPTAQQALAGSVVAPNLVLTRWLVQLPEVPAERAADCDFLVGTYDYARAARLMGRCVCRKGSFLGRARFC